MRKHFLVLMLLSLLPLAGWADTDLSSAEVSATLGSSNLTYVGKKTTPAIQKITVDGTDITGAEVDEKFEIEYFKGTTSQGTDGVKNAGTYKFNVKARTGSGYTGTAESVAEFTIDKAELHITAKDATKTYGAADPTDLEYTIVSGLVGDDDVNNVVVNFTLSRTGDDAGVEVGNYSFTSCGATSINYNVTVDNAPKLIIKQATLTATYSGDIVKSYGEANPALDPDQMSYSGWTMSETDEQKAAILAGANLNYTQNETKANADTNGDFLTGITAGYPLTFTGFNLKNYEVALPADKTMKIKQIALAATPGEIPEDGKKYFNYIPGSADFTYTGANQVPVPTIKYFDAQGTEHTLEAGETKDYTLSYTYSATEEGAYSSASDNTKAGYYKVTVTAVTGGNYSGTLAVDALGYQIKKKDLYVTVKNNEKVYDGSAFDLGEAEFEYNGLVAADNNSTFKDAITNVTADYKESLTDDQKKGVGEKVIKAVIAAGSNLNDNYKPQGLATGKYTITKRSVTVTAKSQTITFGEPTPAFAANAIYVDIEAKSGDTGVANDGDKTGIFNAINVALKENYTAADTYEGGIVVTVKDETKAPNYEITPVAGDYKIKGATLTLIAQNKEFEYGEEYSLNDFTYLTIGADPAETVVYEIWKGSTKLTALPTDVDTYDIKIVEKDEYLPTNYETINYVPGTLTITKKTVTITAGDVNVNEGASVADLNTLGKSKVVFKDSKNNVVENIDFKLAYNTEGENAVAVVTDEGPTKGNLNSSAATYAAGYKVVVGETVNENYAITWDVKGKLIVGGASTLVIDATASDIVTTLKVAKGKEYNLSISNHRTLRGGAWYTLVLPFDITVAKLSAALKPETAGAVGYAIVNTLDAKNTTSSTIKFNLHMGTIKANEPFLVKTAEDVDLSKVTLTGTIDVTKIGEPSVANETGDVTFIGLYEKKADLSNTERTIVKDNWYTNRTNIDLHAFEAYLSGCEAKARIFIEDLNEDGTTAIKTLSTETMIAEPAEGWYNLNGVKLDAAPTQKGIYINNGKKVIIR